MKQLIPSYACRKAWSLIHQDVDGRNPDRIWSVMGLQGIDTHICCTVFDKDNKPIYSQFKSETILYEG